MNQRAVKSLETIMLKTVTKQLVKAFIGMAKHQIQWKAISAEAKR